MRGPSRCAVIWLEIQYAARRQSHSVNYPEAASRVILADGSVGAERALTRREVGADPRALELQARNPLVVAGDQREADVSPRRQPGEQLAHPRRNALGEVQRAALAESGGARRPEALETRVEALGVDACEGRQLARDRGVGSAGGADALRRRVDPVDARESLAQCSRVSVLAFSRSVPSMSNSSSIQALSRDGAVWSLAAGDHAHQTAVLCRQENRR